MRRVHTTCELRHRSLTRASARQAFVHIVIEIMVRDAETPHRRQHLTMTARVLEQMYQDVRVEPKLARHRNPFKLLINGISRQAQGVDKSLTDRRTNLRLCHRSSSSSDVHQMPVASFAVDEDGPECGEGLETVRLEDLQMDSRIVLNSASPGIMYSPVVTLEKMSATLFQRHIQKYTDRQLALTVSKTGERASVRKRQSSPLNVQSLASKHKSRPQTKRFKRSSPSNSRVLSPLQSQPTHRNKRRLLWERPDGPILRNVFRTFKLENGMQELRDVPVVDLEPKFEILALALKYPPFLTPEELLLLSVAIKQQDENNNIVNIRTDRTMECMAQSSSPESNASSPPITSLIESSERTSPASQIAHPDKRQVSPLSSSVKRKRRSSSERTDTISKHEFDKRSEGRFSPDVSIELNAVTRTLIDFASGGDAESESLIEMTGSGQDLRCKSKKEKTGMREKGHSAQNHRRCRHCFQSQLYMSPKQMEKHKIIAHPNLRS